MAEHHEFSAADPANTREEQEPVMEARKETEDMSPKQDIARPEATVRVIWRTDISFTRAEREWLLRLLFRHRTSDESELSAPDRASGDGVCSTEHNVPRRRRQPPRGWPTAWEPTWPIKPHPPLPPSRRWPR